MTSSQQLAVFDLENTLVPSNVVKTYLHIATHGMNKKQRLIFFAKFCVNIPRFLVEDKQSRDAFLLRFYKRYRGLDANDVKKLGSELFTQLVENKLYAGASERIAWHREQEHRLLLVTGTLDIMIEPLRFLFDDVIGASMTEDSGALTGELRKPPPTGNQRAEVVAQYAESHGIAMTNVTAYADSLNDIPLLQSVGSPVVINPSTKLAGIAIDNNWKIERWSTFAPMTLAERKPASVPQLVNDKLGSNYDTRWTRHFPVQLLRELQFNVTSRLAARIMAPSRVLGYENLANVKGPIIIAANHASHLDTTLILHTLPWRLRRRCVVAAGADYFFNTRLRATWYAFSVGAVPVERTKVTRQSAALLESILNDKYNLIIFPEGTRSENGEIGEFRAGAAYLAKRTGFPVVPMYLHNTGKVWAKNSNRIHRHAVGVAIGEALYLGEGEDVRDFNKRIESTIRTFAKTADFTAKT